MEVVNAARVWGLDITVVAIGSGTTSAAYVFVLTLAASFQVFAVSQPPEQLRRVPDVA